jgi:DNA-directed RNA polymerase subunit RPC12/RpoP
MSIHRVRPRDLLRKHRPTGHYKKDRDLNLARALRPTRGWNPLMKGKKVVRYRCNSCGTLLGVGSKDMEGEFENKCTVCGLVMVFNRKPKRWGNRHNLGTLERMLIQIQQEGT